MRKQLLLLLFSLFTVMGFARTVTGVVTSATDKEPIIGATVMVQGTQRGAATDVDGKYSIEVKDSETLTFSYVGMNTVSIKVGAKTTIDVAMKENSQVLQEVVVTAMGQTQEKKKLNFAVQTLDADQVTAGGNANFANSLQGKVAGLQVTTGGGSPNSSTQVIIRAISSVNGSMNNEPLMVVDGIAIRGQGSTLADINPNDIESMNVLKGAAASALYGQEGSNGVIMITTKRANKDGKVTVTASGGWEISNVLRAPKIQDTFLSGSRGFYKENSAAGGWGPYLRNTDRVYNNTKDYFETGLMQKYDASISGGTEKFNAYSSIAYMKSDGVVPKDYKDQLTIFLKGEYNPSKQINVLMSANIVNTKSRGSGGGLGTVYGWSIDKDMSDYQTQDGYPNWANRYDNWGALTDLEKMDATTSPYYGRYNDKSESESMRVMLNGQLTYTPIKDLTITGKVGYDKGYSTYDGYVEPRFRDSDFDLTNTETVNALKNAASLYGDYTFEPSKGEQLTVQGFVNYHKEINKDFNVNAFVGVEYKNTNSWEAQLAGQRFLLAGGYYSFNNTDPSTYMNNNMYLYHGRQNKFGYFGELRFDYKGMAQLSVTDRVDGASTMLQAKKTVYTYPSVTAGVIFSELFHLQNSWFSYGKIRGNWAQVGKSGPRYLFSESYRSWPTFPDGGYGVDPTTARATKELAPEMTKSWEIGADLRFFNSWTRLDAAYYSTIVDNQIVSVRVSPAAGMILQTRNEGKIKNHGVEISLNQDIMKQKDFSWTALLNFSLNRGKVLSLPDGIVEIQGTQYGDIFPSAYLNGSTTAISGKDYQRDPDGNVICDVNGYPLISSVKGNMIGNREPDFLMGLGSTFRYKDLTLSFLVDGRCGGDVVNVTGRGLISNGMNHLLAKYRNREIIYNGVVKQSDGTYLPNTTPVILDQNFINKYYSVSSNFIEDGSYIRMSYVTLAYDFTRMLRKGSPVKGLNVTLTGRNLFLLTKYSGSDPQILAGTQGGTGGAGIDNYSVPSTRSFNLTLKATF